MLTLNVCGWNPTIDHSNESYWAVLKHDHGNESNWAVLKHDHANESNWAVLKHDHANESNWAVLKHDHANESCYCPIIVPWHSFEIKDDRGSPDVFQETAREHGHKINEKRKIKPGTWEQKLFLIFQWPGNNKIKKTLILLGNKGTQEQFCWEHVNMNPPPPCPDLEVLIKEVLI